LSRYDYPDEGAQLFAPTALAWVEEFCPNPSDKGQLMRLSYLFDSPFHGFALDDIVSDYGVRNRSSADPIAIWNADPAGATKNQN